MYWTLKAPAVCPSCDEVETVEMQTHWMGEVGSCLNTYDLGQPIAELEGFSGWMPPDESFIARCGKCQTWFDVRALFQDGAATQLVTQAEAR